MTEVETGHVERSGDGMMANVATKPPSGLADDANGRIEAMATARPFWYASPNAASLRVDL